jgi:hypothetical protein
MGFIGLPWARVERKTSAVATFSDLAGELGSGSTGGFPPTFTIAAPRSTEGEAMAKAGGKENIHAQESLGEQASVGAPIFPPCGTFSAPLGCRVGSCAVNKLGFNAGFSSLQSNEEISWIPKKIIMTPSVVAGRTATRSPRNALPSGNALPL